MRRARQSSALTAFSHFSEDYFDFQEDDLQDYANLEITYLKFQKPAEIINQLDQQINEISDVFQLSSDTALLIYQYYRFNIQKLQTEFLLNQEEVMKKLQLEQNSDLQQISNPNKTEKSILCRSCFDETTQFDSLKCGHQFCLDCWKYYIQAKVKDQDLFFPCMLEGCKQPVCHSFVENILKDQKDDLQQYYIALGKKYVDENQQQNLSSIKWCPGVDCIYTVVNPLLQKQEVKCPNGHFWCFICRQEAHSPVSCTIVTLWNNILNQESEDVKWIQQFTKLCPFCHRPVEKACNHLLKTYHYQKDVISLIVALQEVVVLSYFISIYSFRIIFYSNYLSIHLFILLQKLLLCVQSSLGVSRYIFLFLFRPTHNDHFNCPFQNNILVETDEDFQRNILSTYNEHYKGFGFCSKQWKELKNKLLPKLQSVIDKYVQILNITPSEIYFLKQTLNELLEIWQKLKWTFCLTHFIQESKMHQQLKLLQIQQDSIKDEGLKLQEQIEIIFNKFDSEQKLDQNKLLTLQQLQKEEQSQKKQIGYIQALINKLKEQIENGNYITKWEKLFT